MHDKNELLLTFWSSAFSVIVLAWLLITATLDVVMVTEPSLDIAEHSLSHFTHSPTYPLTHHISLMQWFVSMVVHVQTSTAVSCAPAHPITPDSFVNSPTVTVLLGLSAWLWKEKEMCSAISRDGSVTITTSNVAVINNHANTITENADDQNVSNSSFLSCIVVKLSNPRKMTNYPLTSVPC